jgi:serine protease Do
MESTTKPRSPWSAGVLVVGGVIAGLLLAANLDWAPASRASQEPVGAVAVGAPGAVTVAHDHGAPPSFADLAEAVAPAVVTVRSVTYANGATTQPFFDLFRRRQEAPPPDVERREEAGGSGFLVDPRGLVVTNYHVVENASELRVTLDAGREMPAVVRGTDPDTDLAVLQIETEDALPFLELGQMEALRVGDWVMVIGNPLRLGRTVTVGVVSATGRTLGIMEPSFENFIQTDAAINFGNSGGPMVDLQGRVVGVATAIDWGAENIGFAVPVSTLRSVVPQLVADGRVRRGYLGVEIEDVDFDTQRAFGLLESTGVLVLNVVPDTPAARAGLRHGDVILTVDDRSVQSTRELIDYVAQQKPGREVRLDLVREGRAAEIAVLLEERPHAEAPATEAATPDRSGMEWLGIEVRDLTDELKEAHSIPSGATGAWIQVVGPRSPLADERVGPGDLITEVNGRPVAGADDLARLVEEVEPGTYVRFYVRRFDPVSGRSSGFFAFVRKP